MALTRHLTFFGISAGVVILDILTKLWVEAKLSIGESFAVIKDLFHITFVKNYGISFGLFNQSQLRWLWIIVAIGAILIIFYYYIRIESMLMLIAVSFILGGAIGNVIDRLLRGFVIDFVDFRFWPAFNIADSAITIGAALLIIYWWVSK